MRLPDDPGLPADLSARLRDDYVRLADGLPRDLHAFALERYALDIAGEYAGRRIAVPFGKASGQLSLAVRQVERDAAAGLGFCVLKTVIAQDADGAQAMSDWTIDAAHMTVERIVGPRTGREGWTVTWKGRGWSGTFEEYLALLRDCLSSPLIGDLIVAASVKYHLPGPDEEGFREAEYRYTTRALEDVWHGCRSEPMVLEKDFSPTLAGDDRSRARTMVLTWLREVPALIRAAATRPLCLGVKVMNAVDGDAFQLDMLEACRDARGGAADFLVYANRLFDPDRSFEGRRGVAYGGPDLSERNLAVLAAARDRGLLAELPPLSATGNIVDGRTAVEYALAGCTSFGMHTVFQLPDRCFDGRMANKSERVLHRLLLHPVEGLVAHLAGLRSRLGWRNEGGVLALGDLPGLASS